MSSMQLRPCSSMGFGYAAERRTCGCCDGASTMSQPNALHTATEIRTVLVAHSRHIVEPRTSDTGTTLWVLPRRNRTRAKRP